MGGKTRVLMVCLGNICRSPMAEGVLAHLAHDSGLAGRLEVRSAGTSSYHVGERANPHSVAVARRHGVDLSGHRAAQVTARDLADYDYVLGMDRANLRDLRRLARPAQRAQLGLLLDYAPHLGVRDVPDPYYGGPEGFNRVYELIEEACRGLLERLVVEVRG